LFSEKKTDDNNMQPMWLVCLNNKKQVWLDKDNEKWKGHEHDKEVFETNNKIDLEKEQMQKDKNKRNAVTDTNKNLQQTIDANPSITSNFLQDPKFTIDQPQTQKANPYFNVPKPVPKPRLPVTEAPNPFATPINWNCILDNIRNNHPKNLEKLDEIIKEVAENHPQVAENTDVQEQLAQLFRATPTLLDGFIKFPVLRKKFEEMNQYLREHPTDHNHIRAYQKIASIAETFEPAWNKFVKFVESNENEAKLENNKVKITEQDDKIRASEKRIIELEHQKTEQETKAKDQKEKNKNKRQQMANTEQKQNKTQETPELEAFKEVVRYKPDEIEDEFGLYLCECLRCALKKKPTLFLCSFSQKGFTG